MTEFGPQATRDRLLAAAAQQIAEYGYASTTLSRVAASLGLTKGAYAYHFPTKAKIAEALRESFYKLIDESMATAGEIYPAGGMPQLATFMVLLGQRISTDPIARGAATVTFDLSTPRQHTDAMISFLQRKLTPMLEVARNSGQIATNRPVEFQSESIVSILLGSHFISSRTTRPAHRPRMYVLRAMLDMLGSTEADAIIDDVIRIMSQNPGLGPAPTYREGNLVLSEPDVRE